MMSNKEYKKELQATLGEREKRIRMIDFDMRFIKFYNADLFKEGLDTLLAKQKIVNQNMALYEKKKMKKQYDLAAEEAGILMSKIDGQKRITKEIEIRIRTKKELISYVSFLKKEINLL